VPQRRLELRVPDHELNARRMHGGHHRRRMCAAMVNYSWTMCCRPIGAVTSISCCRRGER
jgi:hypothetical protein